MSAHLRSACFVLIALIVSGCGGGGSDAGSAAPQTPAAATFALDAGYRSRVASGSTENFDLSGSCTGTARIATAAATVGSFEGVSGFAASQVSTINFVNCLPATNTATGTTYYNASYVPIGLSIAGGEYSRFEAPPAPSPAVFPVSVRVGDTGTLSTSVTYTDSTKAVATGKRVVSYGVEDDTATTAVANIITRSYDLGNQLLATQQSRFRMAADGSLTLRSIDVQFSTTSSIRLIYTPK